MKTLTVALPGREYNIQIGRGLLARAGEELRAVLPGASRLFVVTDSHVAPLYLERVRASLEEAGFRVTAHTVPAGESSKCAARLAELWEAMMDAGLTRTDAVAALGGGVVGDLAGFAVAGGVAALHADGITVHCNILLYWVCLYSTIPRRSMSLLRGIDSLNFIPCRKQKFTFSAAYRSWSPRRYRRSGTPAP